MPTDTSKLPVIPPKEAIQSGVFSANREGKEETKARAEHFKAQPGPVIPQDMTAFEKPASKEELDARMKELNQKK